MRPLQPPGTCSLKLVDDVVAERHGGKHAQYFKGINTDWKKRVEDYIAAQGSPALVPLWPALDDLKERFHNLYSHPAKGSAQGTALSLLRAHDLNLCPGCGEGGRPNTLDHFLPKGKYPHFSITPYNLYPLCDVCQLAKGSKTGDETNAKFFIHPYFDNFVVHQVLTLSIQPPFEAPTFELAPAAALTPAQRSLVGTHVRELGISERYNTFFKEQHRLLLRLVGVMRESGQDVVVNLNNFRQLHELRGRNSWDHVFYAAVLEDVDFLDYLCNAPLPANL